jgi:hypothetical protein
LDTKLIDLIAEILVIIGGLNWGLYAIDPSYNLVAMLLGTIPMLETAVYGLVALSALYMTYLLATKK